jgi:hypothetical protein
MLLAAVVTLLAYGAAGCGGDDDDGDEAASATELEGLGSSFEEIQELAREEGQVNLVVWAGYAD